MILIRMGYPADPDVYFATSATHDEIIAATKAWASGGSYELGMLDEFLRTKLPVVPMDQIIFRGMPSEWDDKIQGERRRLE